MKSISNKLLSCELYMYACMYACYNVCGYELACTRCGKWVKLFMREQRIFSCDSAKNNNNMSNNNNNKK